MPTPDNPKEIIDIFKELDAARVILEKLRDAVITINIEGEKMPAEIPRLDGEEKQAITTVLYHLSEQGKQIDKLNTEINKLNNVIDSYKKECRGFRAFCRRVRRDYKRNVDDFNYGREHSYIQFLNLLDGEKNWAFEGKNFEEADKELKDMKEDK